VGQHERQRKDSNGDNDEGNDDSGNKDDNNNYVMVILKLRLYQHEVVVERKSICSAR
jgi:hypothetical protein